ncbi:MAG: efflux RND transporter periplasmic adaptor subunit [Hungatella hathewayi]|uniref:efflux RND transporter periplasmic adaptor subunit n=1 Tax=Hungatella TaxID=1649459 RepID=UPI001105C480|nr:MULTISPECIES: efflux RND transporter periplasmic adaptor subunit [Hungatella]MCI7383968.1 efflux RND transporter periplasmic adaptor subunit [Hungatella sp.]MDY6237016.1 efflux RND transporter periplasmic adaptor subunit [Hungatella hathewayi]
MNKNKKIMAGLMAGAAAVIVCAVIFTMTKSSSSPVGNMGMNQESSITTVKAEAPVSGDISLTTGLTGTIEPSDVVYVYAKAAGDVTAVMVKSGDTVSQGQVLIEIDTEQVDSARNSMDSAAVTLSEAQSTLSRMQLLYNSGDLSDQEYEQYSNAVKTAKLQYESAKLSYDKQVEYSTVTAPISGKIEDCDIEVYDRVTQSQELCVISGEGENRISFYVTQRMMKNISVGDKMEVEKNSKTYDAYISEISSMVDSETGLFKIKAQIDDMGEIAAGSTVKLNLVTEHAENAMLVPIDAIYYSNGEAYVYLYQDGKAVQTKVVVGLEDSEHAQITSGLTGSELVVSTWSSNLYEGAMIRLNEEVKDTEMKTAGETVQSMEDAVGKTENAMPESSEQAEAKTGQEA